MIVAGTCQGNATVVVLVRDMQGEPGPGLEATVFSALRQLGVPFMVTETLQKTDSFDYSQHPLLMVPQGATLARLSTQEEREVEEAVRQGMGLLIYEQEADVLPAWIKKLFQYAGQSALPVQFSEVHTVDNSHFICWNRWLDEVVHSDKPLTCATGLTGQDKTALITESGESLLHTAVFGKGRVVLFPFSVDLYAMDYLGHACGADDVFFRSIVWGARKPFLTWSMSAKTGLGIDDCSGSYDHFGYLKVMARHGWKPYLAVFTDTIDEVAHEDIHKAQRVLHDGWLDGSLDIGFHALRYNESFCFNHLERRPLTKGELDDRFARWDAYEKAWGIKASPWAHPHFGEISAAAIPYYERRGIRFLTYLLPLDAAWFDVPSKIPPLENLPPYGHGGYYQLALPGAPSIMACNCVLDNKNRKSSDYVVRTDYLWGHTPFWAEAKEPMLEASARVLAQQIRRGLDSGFYGEGATHEQRIASLRSGELEELFQEADNLLARYAMERCTITEALSMARQRLHTALLSASYGESAQDVVCAFSNTEAIGTEIQLYTRSDGGSKPIRRMVDERRVVFDQTSD